MSEGRYLDSLSPSGFDIFDERSGLGTARPQQPFRSYLFDGANDAIEWTTADIGTLYASWYDVTNKVWDSGTITHGSGKYSFSPGGNVAISNLKIWTDNLSTTEEDQAFELSSIPVNLWFWGKCDDTHPTIAYDSSGPANNGTKMNITPATFHAEGGTGWLPRSWQNEVGYTPGLLIDSNGTGGSTYVEDTTYISENVIEGDFKVEYEVKLISSASIFGVQTDSSALTSANYNQIDAGVQIRSPSSSEVRVWLNGSFADHTVDSNIGDRFAFSREGTTISIARNGVVFHTETGASSSDMHATYTSGASSVLGTRLLYFGGQRPGGNLASGAGYDLTDLFIPVKGNDESQDVYGNTPYVGPVPRNVLAINSNCVELDGIDNHIKTDAVVSGLSFGTDDWMAVAWVKRVKGSAFQVLMGNGSSSSWTDGFRVFITSANRLRIFWGNDSGLYTQSTIDIAQNEWVLVAAGISGGKVSYYVDGQYEDFSDTLESLGNGNPFTVGIDGDGTGYAAGVGIADVRVYHATVTAAHLDAIRTGVGQVPASSDLKVWWPLAEGEGTKHYGASGNVDGTAQNTGGGYRITGDVPPANMLNGYSLYEHATLDPIRVPYGSDGNPLIITPPTGYTKTSDHPAGAWHNGAETQFNFKPEPGASWVHQWESATGELLPSAYSYGDLLPANMSKVVDGLTERLFSILTPGEITPSPATAVATVIDPSVVLDPVSVSPAPSIAICTTVSPVVVESFLNTVAPVKVVADLRRVTVVGR